MRRPAPAPPRPITRPQGCQPWEDEPLTPEERWMFALLMTLIVLSTMVDWMLS